MLLTNSMSSIFLLVINYLFNRSINIGILEMLYNLIISGYNNLSCNHPTPFSLSNRYMTYSRYTCIQLCLNHSRFKLYLCHAWQSLWQLLWLQLIPSFEECIEQLWISWERQARGIAEKRCNQLMGMCDRRDIFPPLSLSPSTNIPSSHVNTTQQVDQSVRTLCLVIICICCKPSSLTCIISKIWAEEKEEEEEAEHRC